MEGATAAGGGAGAAAMDTSNNMVVAVRIRPLSPREKEAGATKCCKVINGKIVVISKAGIAGRYLRSQQGSSNEYAFDAAFDADASQAQVFEQTAKPHIPAVLDGYNVTVFAYGATGAGKTHTMMGSERHGEALGQGEGVAVSGIIPQALVEVFSGIRRRRARQEGAGQWRVSVSYMEVYNEQIYDLIGPGAAQRQPLAIREDSAKGVVVVSGLPEVEVQDTAQVLDLLRLGNRNRKTESTAANQVSSRSHAVLQVCVKFSTTDAAGNDLVRESKLSLIDLAGSERASATLNRGARLQEGANINKSLLALANCINSLAETGKGGRRVNVKYRDSKLTHLLKTSLEGECRLIMIANVNPCDAVFEDSHNTLKYANRAKQIKIKPGTAQLLTQEVPWHEREARLRADNEAMREELNRLKALLMQQQHHHAAPAAAASAAAAHHHHHQNNNSSFALGGSASLLSVPGGGASFLSHHHHAHEEEDSMEVVDMDQEEEGNGEPSALGHASVGHAAAGTEGKGKAAGHGGDAGTRVRELEAMVQEMTRTRKYLEQLVASLEAQKRERDEELGAQRHLVQTLQREIKEKEQEVQSLREMVVHLRTRIDSELTTHTNYAFTDEASEDDIVPPLPSTTTTALLPAAATAAVARRSSAAATAAAGAASAAAAATAPSAASAAAARRSSAAMMEELDSMFSPIKSVPVLGAGANANAAAVVAGAGGRRKSSMVGGKAPAAAAAPTTASAAGAVGAAAAGATTKRRQSQIPRPASHYSTRRATLLAAQGNVGAGKALVGAVAEEEATGGSSVRKAAAAPASGGSSSSSSKKRPWHATLDGIDEKENEGGAQQLAPFSLGGGNSNKRASTAMGATASSRRRESLLQKPGAAAASSSALTGVAQRTRSRVSIVPSAGASAGRY